MVLIKLHLTLITRAGHEKLTHPLQDATSLLTILAEHKIPAEEVGIVIKNGLWAPLDCLVEDKDQLELFPHLEGG